MPPAQAPEAPSAPPNQPKVVSAELVFLVQDNNEYLDLLSGFGVFAIGRNHPTVIQALHETMTLDLPNLEYRTCHVFVYYKNTIL